MHVGLLRGVGGPGTGGAGGGPLGLGVTVAEKIKDIVTLLDVNGACSEVLKHLPMALLSALLTVTYSNMSGIQVTELFTTCEASYFPFSATAKFCRETIVQGLTPYSVLTIY